MVLQWLMHVIIYLSKPVEGIIPRVTPNVNYELWGDNNVAKQFHQL